jgi:hypothetical protein
MSKEIIEGNKLIAEFMKEEDISAIFQTEPFVTEVRVSYKMIDDLEKQGAEVKLYYDDNWNKLMPVIGKINKIDVAGSQARLLKIYQLSHFSPLKELWEAVIEFIKWYNQQTT